MKTEKSVNVWESEIIAMRKQNYWRGFIVGVFGVCVFVVVPLVVVIQILVLR